LEGSGVDGMIILRWIFGKLGEIGRASCRERVSVRV
jgi:hypothetical protein